MPSLLGGDALSQQTLDDIFGARNAAQEAAGNVETAIQQLAGQITTIGQQVQEMQTLLGQVQSAAETVDGAIDTHNNVRDAHGATSQPLGRTIPFRNSQGRFQVATPLAAGDVATKGYVDAAWRRSTGAFEVGSAGVFQVTEDHRNGLLIVSTAGSVEIRMPHPAGFGDAVYDMGFAIRIAVCPSASGTVLLTSNQSGASMIARNPDAPGTMDTEIGVLRPGFVTIVPFRRPDGSEAGPWEWLVTGDLYEV